MTTPTTEAGAIQIWHPSVHHFFEEDLLFFFCKVIPYAHDNFRQQFEAFMDDKGYSGYRFYTLFGNATICIRVWLPWGEAKDFGDMLYGLSGIKEVHPFRCLDVPRHWLWGPNHNEMDDDTVNELDSERVKAIQSSREDSKDVAWAKDQKIIRYANLKPMREGRNYIRFFTVIAMPNKSMHRRDDPPVPALLELTKDAESKHDILRSSVYTGYGIGSILIRGEVDTYYNLFDFVQKISTRVAENEGYTTTYLMSDKDPIFSEAISEAAFARMQKNVVDPVIKRHMPGLYASSHEDKEELQRRGEIERFVKEEILKKNVGDEVFERLSEPLLMYVKNDAIRFTGAMMIWLVDAEKFVRRNLGPFIGHTLGKNRVPAIEKRAGIPPSKESASGKVGALGDYVKAFTLVAKELEEPEPTILPTAIMSNGTNWATLRNCLMHGVGMTREKEGEKWVYSPVKSREFDLAADWKTFAHAFLAFCVQFPKLERQVTLVTKPEA